VIIKLPAGWLMSNFVSADAQLLLLEQVQAVI
jgi:hypothetical protein